MKGHLKMFRDGPQLEGEIEVGQKPLGEGQ